ncbi:hypothetical protein LOTGIDRAFT_175815 [Lottia gigantea]|uniref:Ion transport domain-containing protein n=1 Tax=Lottia gigantea TaxID=225164 RepID=V4BNV6_LOTGI|nr:hypothetical protein LOTGIDRAFT_175815 [Lottia gigantea]ESO90589.1 hypothetical protein LOTGIDRAFT_175815 [Lottia gigantea]
MAVELLDLCYNDSSVQAFNILNKELQDFNNRTIVEISKLANNKFFLAHSCCQKWLGQRWCGKIQIRELDWGIKLPDWFKIYTSVFLVFPMFVWISFKTSEITYSGEENEEGEEDDEEANEDNFMLQTNNMTPKRKQKKTDEVIIKIQNLVDRGETKLPVYKQIFYLWSAPITKFWIHQLFYVLFLALFSVATLMPTCGNVFMNFAVFLWTLMIWLEITRMTYVKKWKYPEVPIFLATVEIGLILVFLLVYLIFRILPHFVDHIDYMTAKFLMSIGLLFFYYRTLAVFLPISRTLGPMLIAIKRMIRKDFLTWFRMFMIVMVSGGISIHASLYPNFPITVDALKKAFARAFFAMFLTKIDDLDGDPSCSYLYQNVSDEYCAVADHSRLEECPYSSFGGYFIVIQYLLITKLILVTLLFAMFSATNAQVSKEALEIWKYQRYGLIVDFEERLRLPAPFTCISYLLMFLQLIFIQLRRLKNSISVCCAKCCRRSQDSTISRLITGKSLRVGLSHYFLI